MDIEQLRDILQTTTQQLRKNEAVTHIESGGVAVTEINAMPAAADAAAELVLVDFELLVVGVDKAKAEARKAELIAVLHDYPEPERLKHGPSYIEVGGAIGDQGAAFQLFALGEVLGLWQVITPSRFGLSGPQARQMAGRGFVMISGYTAGA